MLSVNLDSLSVNSQWIFHLLRLFKELLQIFFERSLVKHLNKFGIDSLLFLLLTFYLLKLYPVADFVN